MRIEDEKLIELLVEETGQSKGKVKDQLDQLKNRIMRAARTGGVVEISRFGTFATKNNVLDFNPSRQLKTEINQKYAGMRAIELMEAYKAGTEVPVDDRRYESPPPAARDRSAADKPAPGDKKVPEINEQHSRQDSEHESSRRFAGKNGGNNGNPEKNWQERQEKKNKRAQAYREQAIKDSDQTHFQEERHADRPSGPETYDPSKYQNNSRSGLFVAALTIAAVLLAGWLLFESGTLTIPGLENSSNTSIATDTTQQTAPSSQSGDQTQTSAGAEGQTQPQSQTQQGGQTNGPLAAEDSEGDIAAAGGANQQDAADEGGGNEDANNAGSNENAAETQEQQPPAPERYGLRGTADGGLSGEFTIVVHSFRLKSTVEDLAVQLSQDGYRTVLSESTGADGSRWRLGLGQFQNREAAEEAAQQLPEPYINNYFIEQI